MILKNNFLKLKLFIDLISYAVFPRTFYVERDTCKKTESCDGSLEKPFPDFFSVLEFLNIQESREPYDVIILKDDVTIINTVNESLVSWNITEMNLTIQAYDLEKRKSKITLNGKGCFIISLFSGSLTLEGLIIEGDPNINYFSNNLGAGSTNINFLNIIPFSNVKLMISSCFFTGTFVTPLTNKAFMGVISINRAFSSKQDSYVEILINQVLIKDCYYLRGFLNSQINIILPSGLTDRTNISILNSEVVNYSNKLFKHWLGGSSMEQLTVDHSDFMIISIKSLIHIENCAFKSSSRILLAVTDNIVSLSNLIFSADNNGPEKSPPEIFYFILQNIIDISNLTLVDSVIYSYDDQTGDRDYSILDKDFRPPTLMNFEKNQGCLGFGSNNLVNIKMLVLKNFTLIKRENFIASVLIAEYMNKVDVTNFTITNIIIDTESRFGYISCFYVELMNEFSLSKGSISALNVYGYSCIMFGGFLLGNNVKLYNLEFNRAYLKTKSNRGELKTFQDMAVNNPTFVFYAKSFYLKTGSNFIVFANNYIFSQNIQTTDSTCLYGCLLLSVYQNNNVLKNINVIQSISELTSSVFCMQLINVFDGQDLNVSQCRANSGVIYTLTYNQITLKNSIFTDNWGIGGAGLVLDTISAAIGLSTLNMIVMINIQFLKGKSDFWSGAIEATNSNMVIIYYSLFTDNEATSSNSLGGAIHSGTKNNFTIIGTKFENNYGTFGGTIHLGNNSLFSIESCIFEKNRGEQAAAIYFSGGNYLILKKVVFLANQGFIQGGLIILGGKFETMVMIDVEFISNKAPFKGNLIEVYEKNKVLISTAYIEYGTYGNGNFLYLDSYNTMSCSNLSITDIYDAEVFIISNQNNQLELNNIIIKNNDGVKSYITLRSSNILKITNVKITNVTLGSTALGFINSEFDSIISIKTMEFKIVTSKGCVFFTAVDSNAISIEQIVFSDIKIQEKGTCMNIIKKNKITLENLLLTMFQGHLNEIFVMVASENNNIKIAALTIDGNFSIEQIWDVTHLIKVKANNNFFIFNNSIVKCQNPNSYKIESLNFMWLEGFDNQILILNSRIELVNFHTFIYINDRGNLSITRTIFLNSLLFDDLLILKRNSLLNAKKVKFSDNQLTKSKALFRIEDRVTAGFVSVSCDTNIEFLKAAFSSYKISKSVFYSGKSRRVNVTSNYLFVNEEGCSASFHMIHIYLRENNDDTLFISSNSSVSIRRSVFSFNKAHLGGVFRFTSSSELTLFQNAFIGNEAELGGVLYFDNSVRVVVSKNSFRWNKAIRIATLVNSIGKGGCFYVHFNDNETSDEYFRTLGNNFEANGAEIGGILYVESKALLEYLNFNNFSISNSFRGSKVRYYGNLVASPAESMLLAKGSDFNNVAKTELEIGEKIPFSTVLNECLFQVITVDFFGQITLGENYFNPLKLTSNSNLAFDFVVYDSFLCFQAIWPSSSTVLPSMTEGKSSIYLNSTLLTNEAVFKEEQIFKVDYQIQRCQKGEYFDLKSVQCFSCQQNFFSFESDFLEPSSCKSCAQEHFNCYGGFNLTPKAGYWRNSIYSTNFIKCPNPEACLGDLGLGEANLQLTLMHEEFEHTFPKGICAVGYKGALCNNCESGYAKTGGVKCMPCNGGISIFLMVFKIILRVMLYYYTIYKAVKMTRNVRKNNLPTDLVYSNCLLKIIILHLQFLRSFVEFPFYYPAILKEAFNIVSFSIASGADKVLNLECFMDFKYIPATHAYSMINILAPIFVVFTIIFFIEKDPEYKQFESSPTSPLRTNQTREVTSMLSSMFTSRFTKSQLSSLNSKLQSLPYLFIISIMLSYDEILSVLVNNFSYINVDDDDHPDYRLVKDFDADFFSEQNQTWQFIFVLPLTVIIGILIPFFIISSIGIAKKRGDLKKELNLLRFGYFFFAYEETHSLYEIVYILRRIFLFCMDIFFIRVLSLTKKFNAQTFSVLMCLFYTCVSIFTYLNEPYKRKLYYGLNKVENVTVIAQALTSWIGCIILSFGLNNNINDIVFTVCFSLGGLINIMTFSIWTFYYWKFCVRAKFYSAIRKFGSKGKVENKSKRLSRKSFKDIVKEVIQEKKKPEESLSNYDIDVKVDEAHNIPPDSTTGWSYRQALKSKREYKQGSFEDQPFIAIQDYDVIAEANGALNTVKNIWRKLNGNEEKSEFLKIVNAEEETFTLSKSRKKIKFDHGRNASLEMDITIQGNIEPKNRPGLILLDTSDFFISLSHLTYVKEKNSLNLKILLKYVELYKLRISKTFNFRVSLSENRFIEFEAMIYLSDFLEVVTDYETVPDDIWLQLINQGLSFSSDSKVLKLREPISKTIIELVKSRDSDNKECYFYREFFEKRGARIKTRGEILSNFNFF